MTPARRVMVLGASGFVGAATVRALEARGHVALPVKAPRLPSLSADQAISYIESDPAELRALTVPLGGVDAVINAAGIAAATSGDHRQLTAANGVLPGLVAAAARAAGTSRFVHVSSAAVQGRRFVLDDSQSYDAFSDYSRSKRVGEELALRFGGEDVVIYRPPGVHGADRPVTRLTAKVASSPLASVAHPPTTHSPQALIENVADAIAFLAITDQPPPRVLIHPWEGLTTSDVMSLLGGKRPSVLPRPLARGLVEALSAVGRAIPWVAGNARRVEMMWFGQGQAPSWLSAVGWVPPAGMNAWATLGEALRTKAYLEHTRRTNQ